MQTRRGVDRPTFANMGRMIVRQGKSEHSMVLGAEIMTNSAQSFGVLKAAPDSRNVRVKDNFRHADPRLFSPPRFDCLKYPQNSEIVWKPSPMLQGPDLVPNGTSSMQSPHINSSIAPAWHLGSKTLKRITLPQDDLETMKVEVTFISRCAPVHILFTSLLRSLSQGVTARCPLATLLRDDVLKE